MALGKPAVGSALSIAKRLRDKAEAKKAAGIKKIMGDLSALGAKRGAEKREEEERNRRNREIAKQGAAGKILPDGTVKQ
jgi:hypothetical protein